MSERIAQIEARLNAASPGPWDFGTAYSADGERELVTKAGKADFLSLALNDNRNPLFVIDNGEVIPAVTGDGPNARANAELIANAPQDLRYLLSEIRKPRTITTAAELDKLRFQAVVLDAYGTPYVCERHRTDGTRNEWRPAGMNHLDESESILYHGPATVVHAGEPAPAEASL